MTTYKYVPESEVNSFTLESRDNFFEISLDGVTTYKVPISELLTEENIRRYHADAGIYTEVDINKVRSIIGLIRQVVSAASTCGIDDDYFLEVVREAEAQIDILTHMIEPSARDIVGFGDEDILYPFPISGGEVVRG